MRLDKPKPDGRGGLIYNIPVNCGKCYNCKKNRVNQWSHRLMQENKVSISAYFVTLTYDTKNVPISEHGVMTLSKEDLQKFFKRLRYFENDVDKGVSLEEIEAVQNGIKFVSKKLKYYAVGEYGTNRHRPHYYIILFNIRDKRNISEAWKMGSIDIQEVNNNTIDYTLKYINKGIEKWDWRKKGRVKEFSLMSKKLGSNFLTKEVRKHYQENLDWNYVIVDKGYKVPMAKYYRNEILDQDMKNIQIGMIKRAVEKEEGKISEKDRVAGMEYRDKKNRRVDIRNVD